MKLIPLTRGLSVKVDDEDFEWLSPFKWCAARGGSGGEFYAQRNVKVGGRWKRVKMHNPPA